MPQQCPSTFSHFHPPSSLFALVAEALEKEKAVEHSCVTGPAVVECLGLLRRPKRGRWGGWAE